MSIMKRLVSLKSAPDWVQFDSETNTVSGTPEVEMWAQYNYFVATDTSGGTNDNLIH